MREITDKEWRYANLLFNMLAFETSCRLEAYRPDGYTDLASEISNIIPPASWVRNSNGNECHDGPYDEEGYGEQLSKLPTESDFCYCYRCFQRIRHNLIHGNKAIAPDSPERIQKLLCWAEKFIDRVNGGGDAFADRVKEIKQAIGIESF